VTTPSISASSAERIAAKTCGSFKNKLVVSAVSGLCRQGYRGHDAQNPRRVFISGQKRGVFGVIKRELRRRSAIEPIIGHLKAEGHLGRCYLKGRAGDAANVVVSAVGHNFRRILA
jgi:hypothetical protein